MSNNKKEYMKEYVLKNREKILEQRRAHYARNREALLAKRKEVYNPDKQRDKRLQAEYGITLEEYDIMLSNQGYRCFCCGVHQDDLKTTNNQHGTKRLVVDHCHTSGAVRKLLCNRCNTVLGLIEEKIEILRAVECYLLEVSDVKEY